MKHYLHLLFVLLLSLSASAQNDTIDFGEITRSSRRYVDLTVRNNTELSMWIKQIEHSPQIVYRLDKEYINPDSTFTIRLQVNPDTTGHFKYVMRVELSNEEPPVSLVILGNVKQMPNYKNITSRQCPQFGKEAETDHSEITIVAVDALTREPIPGSTITIIRDGTITESWRTGVKASVTRDLTQEFLYFILSHDGYETTETGINITPEMATISIPLKKLEKDPEPFMKEERDRPDPERIADTDLEKTLNEQLGVDSTELEEMKALYADFDTTQYKTVNIVFVIDLSSSMKLGEKMTLTKYALHQLVSHLRPEDRIAFVTYDENARLYMPTTQCSDKSLINTRISNLEPLGDGSGTKGIKLGYKVVQKDLSVDEANMVVVITDGAFNNGSEGYKKMVEKYAKEQGIVFSVVGIQSRSNDEKHLTEVAAAGNGRYVPIKKIADAQVNLMKEIKMVSSRGGQ